MAHWPPPVSLPFTADAFFEVFARYNTAHLPLVVAWWTAAALTLAAVVWRPGPATDRVAAAVLAGLWLWGGLVYHAGYFTAINPAAWGFAALFVLQAMALGWFGLVRQRLHFGAAGGAGQVLGLSLAAYALLYPFVSAWSHAYPASPTFGVPCPTGIFTVGLLVTVARPPIAALIVPFVWTLIGGSAAIVLAVTADYVLLACALVLPLRAVARRCQP
ncbi:MAG: DUF6064 family protein [Vicinamibacterales bacterium]